MTEPGRRAPVGHRLSHPTWTDRPARPAAPTYSWRAWIAYLAALGLADDEIALVLGLSEIEVRVLQARKVPADEGRRL